MLGSILLNIALVLQGTGSISGALKTSAGRPAVGVRVTAMAVPQSPLEAASSFSMVSLSETDVDGRYRLENIPPGRYYITAGSVDNPTYFPGTMDLSRGAIVSVAALANISGIDFVQEDPSVRPANTFSIRPALSVPVVVQVEGGGRQPVFASGEFVTLDIIRTVDASRTRVHLSGSAVRADLPSPVLRSEYRLTVNNLPEGYAVKSMSYGSTNLLTDTLKLTDSNFSQLQTLNSSPGSAGIIVLAMNCTVLPAANGASVPSTSGPCMTGTANSSVIITLAANAVSAPPVSGARISGKMLFQSGDWAIYSDSVPGILYADGSFEIRGVTPGRVVRTSIAFISTFGVKEAGDRIVPPTAKASALIFVSERTLDSRIVFWICGSNSWRMAGVAGATIIVLPSTACQKLFVCSEEPGHNSWTSDIRLQFNLVSHRPSSGVRCGRSITITSSGMPRS